MRGASPDRVRRVALLPLLITLAAVAADQGIKLLILAYIPENFGIIRVVGDFIWLIHVKNTGAAFSLGAELQSAARALVLFALPLALIAYLLYAAVFMQWKLRFKYASAIIAGGGIGNMIDRFFRPDGVVDYISVRLYGLFGMERWPTFNMADTFVVTGMILWIFFTLTTKTHRAE